MGRRDAPRAFAFGVLLSLLAGAEAVSKADMLPQHIERAAEGGFLPVVLWHGMGDSCCSRYSMGAVKEAIEAALPGVLVHSIATGASVEADVMSGYFGNVNDQVARVCDELLGMEALKDGFVAVGFSQGAQFLRAVVQRCQHLGPRMHTLVSMGGQHQGVANVPGCWEPGSGTNSTPSLYCRMMQGLLGRGAYNWWVQGHVVQAQYFKDPFRMDQYLGASLFLADINNEVAARRRQRYAANLSSLRRLVLFLFEQDDMVVPRESSHFGFFNGSALLAMEETELYQQDWIGLRALDEGGRLVRARAPGRHMQFSMEWFVAQVVRPYLAVPAPGSAAGAAAALRRQR